MVTDHQPLLTILGPNKGIPSMAAARLQRWAIKLSAHRYEIRRTTEHSNADGLSRLPLQTGNPDRKAASLLSIHRIESLPVTAVKLARATRQDKVLTKVFQYTIHVWPQSWDRTLQPYFMKRD